MTRDSLLPFTKLVLVVSAAVQLIFGVVGEFFTNLFNSFFWTAPLNAWPIDIAHFAFLNYLATGIAALYALKQGSWQGARVYFAFSLSYITFSVIVTVLAATSSGVPPIMWLYVLLSVIYLPAVVWAWQKQSASKG